MKKQRRVLLVALAVLVGSLIGLFTLLEDWKRDLTTNHARLDPNASDPLLRPMDLTAPPEEVADRIERWVVTMPHWTLVSRDRNEEELQLHLTRRTRILRFVDDIYVRLSEQDGGTRLRAESQSRVGKGDLGQNPRNLRELTRGLQP